MRRLALTFDPVPTRVLSKYPIAYRSCPISVQDGATASCWSVKGKASLGSSDLIDSEALELKDKDYLITAPRNLEFEDTQLCSRIDNTTHNSKDVGFAVLIEALNMLS